MQTSEQKKQQGADVKLVFSISPCAYVDYLAGDARHRLDRLEQVGLLSLVLDVRVDEKRVDLGVDVLNCDLEAVEAPRLGVSGGREGRRR